jgi:hypothetical protein
LCQAAKEWDTYDLTLQLTNNVGIILYIWKLKLREVKDLAQDHTARRQQSQEAHDPGLSDNIAKVVNHCSSNHKPCILEPTYYIMMMLVVPTVAQHLAVYKKFLRFHQEEREDGRGVDSFSIGLTGVRVWITKETTYRTAKERKSTENHKRGTGKLKNMPKQKGDREN